MTTDQQTRDAAANAALTGLLFGGWCTPEQAARLAYEYAEAMMKERSK